jgi:hypothetical protein
MTPHKIAIVFKVKDTDKAKNFVESDDLRNVMKAAGVVGKPAMTLPGPGPPGRSSAVPRQVGGTGTPQEKPLEAGADGWGKGTYLTGSPWLRELPGEMFE